MIPQSAAIDVPSVLSATAPVRAIEPAPCTAACPAGVNVKAYVSLIAEGRFAEALDEVRRNCTLPSVCGRVCHAPCEPACRRTRHDDPLAIRALKRFVADVAGDAVRGSPQPPHRTERVAVVGSGPAGLTAAHDLRCSGFPVAIFEAMPEPGGMLRYGIADYRLPPAVLDAEIATVLDAGIDLYTDSPIDDHEAVADLFTGGFSAVLLALGAQIGRLLGVAGEGDSDAVHDALGFLRRVSTGDHNRLTGKVIVIGGGSTAVEAARTALRLGAAPVEVLYRRSRAELRAGSEEVELAEREGITFRFLAAPQQVVLHDSALVGLECLQVRLGKPDNDGRRRPVIVSGTEFVIEADHVIVAVGQSADVDRITGGAPSLVDHGLLSTNPATAMTGQWGLFAAGDVVTGPSTVIEAIAAGHKAAAAIERYLITGTPEGGETPSEEVVELGLDDPDPVDAGRTAPKITSIAPGDEFVEVEQAYTTAEAIAEAARCLRCGPCSECAICAPGCDRRHLLLHLNGASETWLPMRVTREVALALGTNGAVPGTLVAPSSISGIDVRPMRMRYSSDLCRGCVRCIEVCSFDAVHRPTDAADDAPVVFDHQACRGCALCGAVCPTGALVPVAHTTDWWDQIEIPENRELTLVCDGAASCTQANGGEVRCRCVGQADPGVLLDLFRRGVRHLTVVACPQCRFEYGPALAAQHVAETQALLGALGQNGTTVTLASPVAEPVP